MSKKLHVLQDLREKFDEILQVTVTDLAPLNVLDFLQ